MNDQARGTVGQSGETAIERYYRFHAPVYDLTRWTFLFGRSGILRKVAT
jgi:S-adenosylmethionine-diacylgycerolhomoserine-N-methlytransferase